MKLKSRRFQDNYLINTSSSMSNSMRFQFRHYLAFARQPEHLGLAYRKKYKHVAVNKAGLSIGCITYLNYKINWEYFVLDPLIVSLLLLTGYEIYQRMISSSHTCKEAFNVTHGSSRTCHPAGWYVRAEFSAGNSNVFSQLRA